MSSYQLPNMMLPEGQTPMNISPRTVPDIAGEYNLIDSGNEMKLEQIGKYRIVRRAPRRCGCTDCPY